MAGQTFIGIVSDTHGLLRQDVVASLRGASVIFHAGDVGSPQVLDSLREIAPVFAIRGNVDTGEWAAALPDQRVETVAERRFQLVHNIAQRHSEAGAVDWVIYGHSHKPTLTRATDENFLNPGSCGPRRFTLPVSWARLWIDETPWRVEFLRLRDGTVEKASA